MSENQHNKTSTVATRDLLQSLLPEIERAVRWACLLHLSRLSRDEIDDFTQEVVLLLIEDDYRKLLSFDCKKSSVQTWLNTVARHHVRRQLRRRLDTHSLDAAPATVFSQEPDQEMAVWASNKQEMLKWARARLSTRDRGLFDLLLEEPDATVIAKQLGVAVKAVYRRKHVVIRRLQSLLSRLMP
jgi:RNA polymerase sigma factor (sigma-70 family)